MSTYALSHLKQLEQESIHIMREVAAEFENPVMLYSVRKASSVMLRLAQKAFAHMTEPMGEPNLPELGVHLLVGNDILTKAYNLHRNLDDERVSLIETVAVKPVN